MSQDFQDVTLNTEISQGLDLLQKRDLTAATRSDSQTRFPVSPKDGHVFCHSGEKQIYAYVDGKWTPFWNYEHGAPYTINELDIKFQPLHENLTNMSAVVFSENTIFAFPQLSYKITPKWFREFGKCEDKNEFTSLEELKDIAFLNTINGEIHISESTIPPSAFEKDLETEVPREMSTGCIKRTFAPTWDQTKWILCDGSTIGSPVSNAKFRGNSYKSLFLSLGGTEGMWNSGQTIAVPDYTGNNYIVSNTETKTIDIHFGFKAELEWRNGYPNYETFTLLEDSIGEIIIQAGGGGGGAASGGGKKNRGGAPGGSGAGLKVSTILKKGHYKLTLGKYGPGAHGAGSGSKFGSSGTTAQDCYLEYENEKIITIGGGKYGNGGASANSEWWPSGVAGDGGQITINVSSENLPFSGFVYCMSGTRGQDTRGAGHYWFGHFCAGPLSPYQTQISSQKTYGVGGHSGSSGGGDGGNSYFSFSVDRAVRGLTTELPIIYCNFLIRT